LTADSKQNKIIWNKELPVFFKPKGRKNKNKQSNKL